MPKDSVTLGLDAAGRSAAVGLVVAAAQNTLAKHNQGAMGVLTRSGGVIAMFGTSPLIYPSVAGWHWCGRRAGKSRRA